MSDALEIAIRVLKLGNGDAEAIAALERVKASTTSMGAAATEASGGMHELHMLTGRTGLTLLRFAGVPPEITHQIHAMHAALRLGGAGLAGIGVVALGSAAMVGWAAKEFMKMKEAGEQSSQSILDLVDVEKKHEEMLKRYGLSLGTTRREIFAFTEAQLRLIDVLNGLDRARETTVTSFAQQLALDKIRSEREGDVNQLGIRTGMVGAVGEDRFSGEIKLAEAEGHAKREVARIELANALQRKYDLQDLVKRQEEYLGGLAQGTKEWDKQREQVDKTWKLISEVKREIERLDETYKAVKATTAGELGLRTAEVGHEREDFNVRKKENELTLQRELRRASEDLYEVEARTKGVQDSRVAAAYAFLRATGQAADAQRLITLEMERQRKAQESATAATRAGQQIAALGGLNVNAIADRGRDLAERSYLRNLASDFQNDYQREANRVGRTSRDRSFVQDQMAAWSSDRLAKSPDLARVLGVELKDPMTKTDARKEEMEKLIASADSRKAFENAGRKLEDIKKGIDQADRQFGKTGSEIVKGLESLNARMADVESRLRQPAK